MKKNTLVTLLMGWLLCLFTVSQANAAKITSPYEAVEATTGQLISLIIEAKGYAEQDPERFYKELNGVINPMIDFPSFTRSVMGEFGTRGYYSSLSKPEKAVYREQYKRFVSVFSEGLIQTYAKGLLVFNGQKIEVFKPVGEELAANMKKPSVDVTQYIYGTTGKRYEVKYKMRRNKAGDWKIRNVIVESINIGKVYRGQFEAAMSKHGNDLKKVVDTWSVAAGESFSGKDKKTAAN